MSSFETTPSSTRSAWLLAGSTALLALLVLLPGLGDYGFWSDAEMPVVDRTRAALGAALSGLERSPWLPDAVRTASYDRWPSELGIRLPHAIAGAGLAAVAAALARWRGATTGSSLLTGLFVLALPSVVVSARTVLGNPIGELAGASAVLFGLVATRAPRPGVAALAAVAAAVALASAIASAGLVIGGAIPLLALATADHGDRTRRIAPVLWLATALVLAVAIRLVLQQGDGYIPLLGAAKALELVDKPETRRFAAVLQEYGEQVAPWAGLAAVGAALGPRGRWPALWAITALVVCGGWSLVFGTVHLPVAVPTALCCTAAVDAMRSGRCTTPARRLIVFVALAGMLVMRKDAERTPARVAVPVWHFELAHRFPDEALEVSRRLKRNAALAMLALVAASILSRRREDEAVGRIEAALRRVPNRWRDRTVLGVVGLAAANAALVGAQGLVPDMARTLGPSDLLARYARWVEAGALPAELGVYRVRDPGLAYYGPERLHGLQSRREVLDWLTPDEPRVALVRDLDLPPLVQNHRAAGLPLFVLHAEHERFLLVSNVLPEGAVDRNPIAAVLFDAPPALEHETRVRFESYLEVVAWEVREPLVRGTRRKLRLVLQALRPVPGGTKIYARFLRGRMSRINAEPHEIASNLYPPNLWRAGDFILHEIDIDVPPLEILSGRHELVVGLRRSEKQNYEITIPEEASGEHGVVIKDKKRNFAVLGEVRVW
jgi:hypothetical protein